MRQDPKPADTREDSAVIAFAAALARDDPRAALDAFRRTSAEMGAAIDEIEAVALTLRPLPRSPATIPGSGISDDRR